MAGTVRAKCPHCGVSMEIDEKFVGKQGRCGKCRKVFTVEAPKSKPASDNPFDTMMEDPFEISQTTQLEMDNPFLSAPSEPSPKPTGEVKQKVVAEALKPKTMKVEPPAAVPPKAESTSKPAPVASAPPKEPASTAPEDNPFAGLMDSEDNRETGEDNPFATFETPTMPTGLVMTSDFLNPAPAGKEVIPTGETEAKPPVKPAEKREEPAPAPAIFPESQASEDDNPIPETIAALPPSVEPATPFDPPKAPVQEPKEQKPAPTREVIEERFVPSRVPPSRSAANFANHKIEAVEATLVELPCKGTFLLAGGTYAAHGKPTPRVLVKVVGTNGVAGWGEVTPCPTWCYETTETILSTIRNYLAPAVRGLPAWDVDRVVREMDRVIQPGATIGQPLAKSGIDSALHDMLARTLEVPLHVLLGGKRVDSIWLSYIISAHSAEEAVEQAKKGLQLGYTAFKVKVGMNNEVIDRQIVEAVKESSPPDTFLWVDANQGYGVDTAMRQAQYFGRLGVQAFEQPLKGARISAFRRLVNLQSVPIALDETLGSPADLIEHIKAEAVDLPVAKLQRCGGHRHSSQFCTVAEAAGLRLMGSGLCETDLGLSHGIQLFSAFGIDLPCDLNGRQFVESCYLKETVTVENGRVAIPDRPGCGVEVDEDKVAQYKVDC